MYPRLKDRDSPRRRIPHILTRLVFNQRLSRLFFRDPIRHFPIISEGDVHGVQSNAVRKVVEGHAWASTGRTGMVAFLVFDEDFILNRVEGNDWAGESIGNNLHEVEKVLSST